ASAGSRVSSAARAGSSSATSPTSTSTRMRSSRRRRCTDCCSPTGVRERRSPLARSRGGNPCFERGGTQVFPPQPPPSPEGGHAVPPCETSPLLRNGGGTSRFPLTPSPAHRPKVGL